MHFQSLLPTVIFHVELGIIVEFLGCSTNRDIKAQKAVKQFAPSCTASVFDVGVLILFLDFSPWVLATEIYLHMWPEGKLQAGTSCAYLDGEN